jgi:hypothetical protein
MPASQPVDQTDLKQVRGIGRKVEARLKAAGVTDLGLLARTPVNEVAAILTGLPGKFDAGRIARESWLAQAGELAARSAGEPEAVDAVAPVRHNFTVEVRVDLAGRQIGSARIVHVQTSDEESWHGWKPGRLVAFIEERAGNRPAEPAAPGRAAAGPDAEPAVPDGSGGAAPTLRVFAIVPGSGPDISMNGPIRALLTFDPAAVRPDLAGRDAQVRTEVFVGRRPPAGSILIGSGLVPVRGDTQVRLEIPCRLPVMSRPADLFATVRVMAAGDPGRRPSRGLAGASLEISA